MAIYELASKKIVALEQKTFGAVDLKERSDLQRLLRDRIDVVAPDTMVLAEEFGQWEESKRRIDLLALDKNANLLVIELKRTEHGGHMELQALRYAAMVSAMTFDQAVAAHEAYRKAREIEGDARSAILQFLECDVPAATAILDRFLHHAELITITGKSYRLRNKTQARKTCKTKQE